MATRIEGITIKIGGDTTELTKALDGVYKKLRESRSQLGDVDKLLKLDPGNTELLKQKFSALGEEINATKDKLATLKEAEKQMTENGQVGTAEWDALQREIIATEQSLKGLNKEMDKFGSVSAQKIAAAGEQVKTVGDKITSAGQAIMPASVAMIGLGTAAATKFAEVDKVMQLTNATMGNTEEQAKLLDKAMSEAAANSTFGMSDAANATLNFARAGLTAEQAAAALAPAMNLAAGEGGNLDTVSAGLVATINGFHDSFENTAHYADVFAAACNNSALDVDSLSNAMSVAAPIFATAGYKIEDAALYMGVMANNGIDANVAANALKTGFARLVSPAKQGAEAMEKYGISVTKADGSMKDSATIQRELHDTFAKLSESEQMAAASAIFGKNQMAPWLALINTAPKDVNELSESLTNCAGTTDDMAESMMSGFGGSIEKLKSSLDVLMTSLGKVVAEFLTPIVQHIQKFVDWLNSLDEKTRKLIVTIGAVVAAAGPVLIFVGKLTSAVGSIMTWAPKIVTGIGKLKGLLAGLGGAIQSVWAFLAANPIVLVIAAVAALVAAFIHFWRTSEGFRNFWINLGKTLVSVWEGFKQRVSEIWNGIKETASTVWTSIKDFFTNTWTAIKQKAEEIWNGIKNFFANLWENIKSTATTAWEGIKGKLTSIWEGLRDKASEVWGAIKEKVSAVTDATKEVLQEKWNNIKNAYHEHGGGLNGIAYATMEALKAKYTTGFDILNKLTGGKLDGIKEAFRSAWEDIKNIVHDAIEKLKSFFNFKWELPKIKLPHFSIQGSFSLNPPSVPHLSVEWYKKAMKDGMILTSPTIFGAANGRLLAGGEAGPEAVVGVDSLRGMIAAAVQSASSARPESRNLTVILELDRMQLAHTVYKLNSEETQRVGVRLAGG